MSQFDDSEYSFVFAKSSSDFGVCYYCGCEADEVDYVPPLKFYQFYRNTGECSQFLKIPACQECYKFLLECKDVSVDKRMAFVKGKISRRYKKAISIYYGWSESDDLSGMSFDFVRSIRAGLVVGKEAYDRVRYAGFEYEFNSELVGVDRKVKIYDVKGEKFDNYRNAVQFASRSYNIGIKILSDLLLDTGADFNKAIDLYYEKLELEIYNKKKRELIADFCELYSQNKKFVERAVNHYMEKMDTKDVKICLDALYEEKIKDKN